MLFEHSLEKGLANQDLSSYSMSIKSDTECHQHWPHVEHQGKIAVECISNGGGGRRRAGIQ